MSKKNLAEWIAIIICLLPSPMILMFVLSSVGALRESYPIHIFWAFVICAAVGLFCLWLTSWVLTKLVYFIIK